MTYFVICVDYGKRGREAIVDPEMTFRGAVEAVCEAWAKGHTIAFAHEVNVTATGIYTTDIKDELVNRAEDLKLEAAE